MTPFATLIASVLGLYGSLHPFYFTTASFLFASVYRPRKKERQKNTPHQPLTFVAIKLLYSIGLSNGQPLSVGYIRCKSTLLRSDQVRDLQLRAIEDEAYAKRPRFSVPFVTD